jgi:TPP-dependent pyruvate/acetoin dehydrogenase alpha subunit
MDDKTRLELYRVMVLSRTYEEAILREYHADKKPAFDIGARRRGRVCPPARG